MLSTQTALDAYFLPDDADSVIEAMTGYIDSAKSTLRVICYGFTHPTLIDALIRAYQRGVDVRLILDLTQSKGPTEAAQLHRMMLSIPPDHFRIGTSTRHAIIHDKVLVVDGLADVPDGQYATAQEARTAGYPVTLEGSFNWSPSAEKQMNTLLALPSKPLARHLHAIFDDQWTWLEQHEPQYQVAVA